MQNHIVRMMLPMKRAGVYWFNFLLGDKVKSRVPLRVIYQRMEHPKQTDQPTWIQLVSALCLRVGAVRGLHQRFLKGEEVHWEA